jgi:hypothetical protein
VPDVPPSPDVAPFPPTAVPLSPALEPALPPSPSSFDSEPPLHAAASNVDTTTGGTTHCMNDLRFIVAITCHGSLEALVVTGSAIRSIQRDDEVFCRRM